MDKTQFNEALVSLIEYAAANANHVSKKDIELHFKEILTDESMYTAIYSYLKESKITIDDVDDSQIPTYNKAVAGTATDTSDTMNDDSDISNSTANTSNMQTITNTVESEEELAVIEMYKNDMANIEPLTDEDKSKLIKQLVNGDSLAAAKLTEGYLFLAHQIATSYRGRGLNLSDLIQEGNIGLMLALSEYNEDASDDSTIITQFEAFLKAKISESLEEAISMQVNSERIGSHLAERMNSLDNLSRDLTEKLGHAPSVKELAWEMNISEEEVDTIIRTSLNVLSVEQSDEE